MKTEIAQWICSLATKGEKTRKEQEERESMDQQATKPEPCGEYSGPELKLCISQASGKGERAGEISPRV